MFHKADLKTQSYEPINEEKFDKTMIIKSFEENANFKFNETTGVIISALEYIQNKYFNTKPKEKPKIANISKDEITGKITFSDKPKELKDVPRSSLHEDRFYSEIITKSFAPDDIRDHMVKL
ncbi:MAG TPA: hypothetical protein P5052_01840 [Candidatus Paceibacterota bacterium]|nr:hypothetical protein [Candidatus Paceibacterota bacterium]HRZ29500.1 hypothetical protein [Candidatus Paceibacterota bacterium]